MESPDVFNDEFIVDELLDFFVAATQSTDLATQNMLEHIMMSPKVLEKVRAEFKKVAKKLSDQG